MYISIGIPFYNAEKYLDYAICSVLAQTHTKWELILIDDGSTDKSLDIAEKYAKLDNRIRVISDGFNKKLPYRLNQIIEESKYDYIARMDADDLMSNNRLEIQLQYLCQYPNIDFISTGYLTIDENNKLTGVRECDNYQMDAPMILQGITNILHASLLARKSWYQRNTYNTENVLAEDYELWLTAAKKNDLKYIVINQPLYWYRVTENVTLEKLVQGYNSQIQVIEKYYKGLISEKEKFRISNKFKLKKMLVKGLNRFNLLNLLLNRRSDIYTPKDLEYYNINYSHILQFRCK